MQTPDDTHLPEDEWVENTLKHYDGKPLTAAALCPACRKIKPFKAFQRYMTPGEAKYRGYDPMAKVLIETEKCKDCRQPKRTQPTEFSPAELQRKAQAGHLPAHIANQIAVEKLGRARSAQRNAVEKRWDEERQAKWEALIYEITGEINAVMQQANHAKKKGTHLKVVTYTQTYLKILRRIKADMKLAKRNKKRHAEHGRWQEYVLPYEKNQIAGVWNDIDFTFRQQGMRPPQAFAREFGDGYDVPKLKVYVPPVPKPKAPGEDEMDTSWVQELTGPVELPQPDPEPTPQPPRPSGYDPELGF